MTSEGPEPSPYDLIVRPESLSANINTNASIETTIVEEEFTEELMESNYTSMAIAVSAPLYVPTGSNC